MGETPGKQEIHPEISLFNLDLFSRETIDIFTTEAMIDCRNEGEKSAFAPFSLPRF